MATTHTVTGAPVVVDNSASTSIAIENTGTVAVLCLPLGRQILPGQTVTVPGWKSVQTIVQTAGQTGSVSVTLTAGTPAARPGPGPVTFDPGAAGTMTITISGEDWYTDEGLTHPVTWPFQVMGPISLYPAAPVSATVTATAGTLTRTEGLVVRDWGGESFRLEPRDDADRKAMFMAAAGGTFVQAVAPATGVAATDSAAVQAAHDALPATGGQIMLRAGTYALGATGLTFSKPVRLTGAGGTDGAGGSITQITYSGGTGNAITVSASGCYFDNFELVNTSGTAPTAGAGIAVTAGNFMRISRVTIDGFYDNVDIDGAYYYTISDSAILNPVNYGVYLRNTAHTDNGDQGIFNCVFAQYNVASRTGAAAVRWESGGGLRFLGNKINGKVQPSGVAAWAWPVGLDIAVADGVVTADFLITGNSIEGCDNGVGLYVRQAGTTGTVRNVVVSGNQFMQASMYVTCATAGQFKHIAVTGNVFDQNTSTANNNGCRAKNVDGLTFTGNGYEGAGAPLALDTGCTNVHYVPGDIRNRGFLFSDVDTTSNKGLNLTNVPTFSQDIPTTWTSTSAYSTMWATACPPYSAGTIEVNVFGNFGGAGGSWMRATRTFKRANGAVTIATLGTDDTLWPGANPVFNLQFTDAGSGKVTVGFKLDATGGASSIQAAHSTLKVTGGFVVIGQS